MSETLPGIPLQFVVTLLAVMPMVVLVTVADNLTQDGRTAVRVGALIVATLAGVCASALLMGPVGCLVDFDLLCSEFELDNFVAALGFGLFYAVPLVLLLFFLTRTRRFAARLHAEQMHRADLDRQVTEARLKTLRAQIEPHFLFNTLAHIQRLYQVQPAQGRSMLRNLSDYLQSALPQMRSGSSTLGREVSLVRAYLNVQQIRMGRRLGYAIEVPAELDDAALPSMMLVTLVENAIKHGIGPKREGGQVRIEARLSASGLDVEVRDDGVGLPLSCGTGVGLANTRARLTTLFGDLGRLEIMNRTQGGVSASLHLPYHPTGVLEGAA